MFSHLTLLSFLKIMKSLSGEGKEEGGRGRLRTKNSSGKFKTYEIFIRSFITAFFIFFFLTLKTSFSLSYPRRSFSLHFFCLFVKLKKRKRGKFGENKFENLSQLFCALKFPMKNNNRNWSKMSPKEKKGKRETDENIKAWTFHFSCNFSIQFGLFPT